MSTPNDSFLAEGYWMACDHPERPFDDKCCYHIAITGEIGGEPDRVCNGCLIAATAAAANGDMAPFFEEAMRNGDMDPLGHWIGEQ